MKWAGHLQRKEERRGAYRALVGRPEGKKTPGKPERRWNYNNKM